MNTLLIALGFLVWSLFAASILFWRESRRIDLKHKQMMCALDDYYKPRTAAISEYAAAIERYSKGEVLFEELEKSYRHVLELSKTPMREINSIMEQYQ